LKYESFQLQQKRGLKVVRTSGRNFGGAFRMGFGALSDGVLEIERVMRRVARVVATLIGRAKSMELSCAKEFRFCDWRKIMIALRNCGDNGERIAGDVVVMAVGAWTPYLLPFTKNFFRATGQPVFHLKPSEPELFALNVFRFSARILRRPDITVSPSTAMAS